jgi:nucleoside-diphosphate kinase
MAIERTCAILKPDCVRKELVGEVIRRIQDAGFHLLGMRMIKMSKAEAEGFYQVHADKPFFDDLTDFMSSGSCVPIALQKDNAIEDFRDLIGATDPSEAEEGTIRSDFADSIERNIVHGSDSPDNGIKEVNYFFSEHEIVANVAEVENIQVYGS